MRTPLYQIVGAGSLVLLAGCASAPPAPVASVNPPAATQTPAPFTGYLEIFADLAPKAVYDTTPAAAAPPPYQIYDDAGHPVFFVPHQAVPNDNTSMIVNLPAGHYKVVAHSPKAGEVTVPVIIKAGRTTLVNLADRTLPKT